MRWLADECVAAPLVARLREAGHDVVYIAETATGATDTDIMSRSHAEHRILLTEDKDFGELVVRRRWPAAGVVLLRTGSDEIAFNWMRPAAAIDSYQDKLFGRLTVVEEARLRSRLLSSAVQDM